MKNYYLLNWKHKLELASAFYIIEDQVAHELISQLDGRNELPSDFELRKVAESRDGLIINDDLMTLTDLWLDYLPNSLAWPIMSEGLKSVIENNLTGNEPIDWLTCKIKIGSEEKLYYILRFNKKLDVLDMGKTIFLQGTDHIIKPVFSVYKIQNYNILPMPLSHNLWKITSSIYISESLKKAIQRDKLTGINFEKTSVV